MTEPGHTGEYPSSSSSSSSNMSVSLAQKPEEPPIARSRLHLGHALTSLIPRWLPFRGPNDEETNPAPEAQVQPEPLADPVEASCLSCAAARAAEEALPRDERLFHDPLARILAGPRVASRNSSKGTSPRIAIRTKYFDDFVEKACASGVRQVVILGAGMDARAYRLEGVRGASVFEVDVENVLQLKESLLASTVGTDNDVPLKAASLFRVVANVAKVGWDASLVEAGFNWRERTVWVLEGLVYYLEEDRVEALLRTLRFLSGDGSVACASLVGEITPGRKRADPETSHGATRIPEESVDGGRDREAPLQGTGGPSPVKRRRPSFVFACPNPREFFSSLGFVVHSVTHLGGEGANFGRWPAATAPASNTMYVTFGVQ